MEMPPATIGEANGIIRRATVPYIPAAKRCNAILYSITAIQQYSFIGVTRDLSIANIMLMQLIVLLFPISNLVKIFKFSDWVRPNFPSPNTHRGPSGDSHAMYTLLTRIRVYT